jgi:hypothetical protein
MRRFVAVVLAGSVLAAAGIAFSPAAVAGPEPVRTKSSKHADGPWSAATKGGSLGPGEKRSFYFRVRNNSGVQQDTVTFEQFTPFILGFAIKWYKANNNKNVTAAVTGDGYQFKLAPGARKVFRVKIKSDSDNPLCLIAESDIDDMPPAVSNADVRVNTNVCV